jgi:diaminopimelate epimerase
MTVLLSGFAGNAARFAAHALIQQDSLRDAVTQIASMRTHCSSEKNRKTALRRGEPSTNFTERITRWMQRVRKIFTCACSMSG